MFSDVIKRKESVNLNKNKNEAGGIKQRMDIF